MRVLPRSGLMALTALGIVAASGVLAQSPPATKGAAPVGKSAAAPVRPSNPLQVLATVNGEPITKADLLNLIVRYRLPTEDAEKIYEDGIETLANTKLINQFLARQRLPVATEKIDAEIAQLKQELKEDGRSLDDELFATGKTVDDVRKEMASLQQWREYLKLKATDAELQRFVANNQDLFNGVQVKASHVLIKLDPKASPDDERKAKDRLLQIKADIEAGKLTFAQAANKFSEDPSKAKGDGGDVGYFTKSGEIIEAFADAAFALKVGQISDPVRTVHGYHLIQATDRKEGQKFDFEAKKQLAFSMYAVDLQKRILIAAKKGAKVEVKPMPSDLFPPAPVQAPAPENSGATKDAKPKS